MKLLRILQSLFPHLVLIVLLLVISKLPIYIQTKLAPKDTYFTKTSHNIPPPDYYWYLSVINQGRYTWSYTNQFSTEFSAPITTFLYYSILGRIASLIGISNIGIFHLANLINLLFFYIASLLLVRLVIPFKKYQ